MYKYGRIRVPLDLPSALHPRDDPMDCNFLTFPCPKIHNDEENVKTNKSMR